MPTTVTGHSWVEFSALFQFPASRKFSSESLQTEKQTGRVNKFFASLTFLHINANCDWSAILRQREILVEKEILKKIHFMLLQYFSSILFFTSLCSLLFFIHNANKRLFAALFIEFQLFKRILNLNSLLKIQ